jgi:hypothetical protein
MKKNMSTFMAVDPDLDQTKKDSDPTGSGLAPLQVVLTYKIEDKVDKLPPVLQAL